MDIDIMETIQGSIDWLKGRGVKDSDILSIRDNRRDI
jgi:hypothetical protein